MLCEKCGKKEATFYYRENVNGVEKSWKLCADCAAQLQKSGEISGGSAFGEDYLTQMQKLFSGDDLFGSLLSPQKERTTGKTCSLCGSSFADLSRMGKVGCPRCYEAFANELIPSIRRIHGRTEHTGHTPRKFQAETEKKQKIAALEQELKKAIAEENYEHAAELRDNLRALRDSTGQA